MCINIQSGRIEVETGLLGGTPFDPAQNCWRRSGWKSSEHSWMYLFLVYPAKLMLPDLDHGAFRSLQESE